MKYVLEQLKAGRLNHIERTWPGTDIKIKIRPLTGQDDLDATLAADRIFKDAQSDVSVQNVRTYEAERDTQRLYRACSDIEGNPLAPTVTDFRKSLTIADKAWLIDQYAELEEEVNPSLETMPDAEFDALVESVKKNPDTALNVLSMSTLRRLARFLASPPVNLPTGNGHTSP